MKLTTEDIRARVEALSPWFHDMDLNGVRTAPDHFLPGYPASKFLRFAHALPADLTDKSVLDIGCNAGFYSFEMRRRGAARDRGADLAQAQGDPAALRRLRLAGRRVEHVDRLERLGLAVEQSGEEHRIGSLVVDPAAWAAWREALTATLRGHHEAQPLSAGLTPVEVAHAIDLPSEHAADLVPALAEAARLAVEDGRVRDPQAGGLGLAEG